MPTLRFGLEGDDERSIEFALDAPSSVREPEGTCSEQYCYSPHVDISAGFVYPNFYKLAWSDFENGAPSAHGDPSHALGFTWTIKGERDEAVRLDVSGLTASAP
jgi:hypothetical protein